MDPDDNKQQGADDEDNELQQRLKDGIGETVFTLQDLPQRVQQHGQGKLRVAAAEKDRKERSYYGVKGFYFAIQWFYSLSIQNPLIFYNF